MLYLDPPLSFSLYALQVLFKTLVFHLESPAAVIFPGVS